MKTPCFDPRQPTPIATKKTWLSAFTLLELLVVIVVIAILAGLMMGAIQRARDTAKKTRALAMMNNVAMAIKLYYNEYGHWPDGDADTTADTVLDTTKNENLYRLLIGTNVNLSGNVSASNGNGRRIVFCQFKSSDVGLVDTSYNKASTGKNNVINPWGNALRISLDYNGDNQVDLSANWDTKGTAAVTVPGEIAIWTLGGKGNVYVIKTWQ
jgi:prepilin-type N-terminal cleavage/methylation domain-containing protein